MRAPESALAHEPRRARDGMIPIRDDNPVRGLPVVTALLILACIGVYLWLLSLPPEVRLEATTRLGFIPGVLFRPGSTVRDPWVSPYGAIFTAMFVHGGFFHLAVNMLYLWIFGDNVEDRVGRGRFVAFYLICGAIAALAQALPDMRSGVPMIGASGAVSGVLGAYLVLYPRANVLLAMPFLHARVPVIVVVGVWFAGQLARSLLIGPGELGVAFSAHVAGFIGGVLLVRWFARDRRKPAS
jgi:membrane associated rhomboid family serine protease